MPDILELNGIGRAEAIRLTGELLHGADDGELFLEMRETESIVLDDNRIRSASFDQSQGFGLRAVSGEAAAYSHSTEISASAMKRAGEVCRSVFGGRPAQIALAPRGTNRHLYGEHNPAKDMAFAEKVKFLEEMNAFARALDPRVRQVTLSIGADWQNVEIIRADGASYRDVRPLVRFNASVVCDDGMTQGQGSHGFGGRSPLRTYVARDNAEAAVREALRQAVIALDAKPAPAGEMDVVLGPGWPGILLHEAIGHGLEGDFNRKGTSAFAGLMGQRIASEGVTIVDDGTLPDRRGSITFDDEGTPSNCTTLIENGILVGYMQDRLNARLMGATPTGNGRRQSFSHIPMPRMTNTYMLAGQRDPGEVLQSVKRGLFAKSFGGGQVDITSGKFVFSCTEAYLIEDGRLTQPVKGATIIGNGADALTRISMIGNDMELDPGIGTCGKQGQGVPVGVGQPTLRLDRLTIGGTAAG